MDEYDAASPEQQRALTPLGDIRTLARQFCAEAERSGNLASTGNIWTSDAFTTRACVQVMTAQIAQVPVAQRRFSTTDWALFSKRYCTEAVERGLVGGARAGERDSEIVAFRDELIDRMIASGEIHELP